VTSHTLGSAKTAICIKTTTGTDEQTTSVVDEVGLSLHSAQCKALWSTYIDDIIVTAGDVIIVVVDERGTAC